MMEVHSMEADTARIPRTVGSHTLRMDIVHTKLGDQKATNRLPCRKANLDVATVADS